MTKFTINLDGDYMIAKGPRDKSWQGKVTCALGDLPESIITDLVLHGLKQKVADAASGATTVAEAEGPMQKALDAIMAGEWSSRGASDGASMETIVGRSVMRNSYKLACVKKEGKDSPAWATFTGLADAGQIAKLDEWLAGPNGVAIAPAIAKEIALRKERAANKIDAAKGVDFDL